ncbi:jg16113 [Pararge aegeria aegeria]|uniref:Jg16113 protein n=1 Tax=Pararge aegeria aegeria TaxID=348720 RepID=A0A8S4QV79_9NEOP|nr:jg16113 [Pararge aegeria aegeria]
MNVGVPRCWNGDLAPVNVALVDPTRCGRMTSSQSLATAVPKPHKTVVFGTPYKRHMSSSGRLLVDMMILHRNFPCGDGRSEFRCHQPSSRGCRTRRLREYNGERAAASSVLVLACTPITKLSAQRAAEHPPVGRVKFKAYNDTETFNL